MTINYNNMQIRDLAVVIQRDWEKPYFGAIPYLNAMHSISDIDSMYYLETAKSVVLYFLSNASTWRGETARTIKKELKRRCK